VQRVTTMAGLVAATGLVIAGLVVAFPLAAEKVVRAVVPSDRVALRLIELIEGIRQGLSVLRSPARFAGVAAWSVILWLVNALSFYLAFQAFELPVNFAGALVLQGVLAFGIAVPSAPGYVGPFEAAITAVLAIYGIGASQAVAYAVGYHLTTFIPITLLGVWSATRTGLGFRLSTREEGADA
jgi:uncharacterized protein (TIRG00374 family)